MKQNHSGEIGPLLDSIGPLEGDVRTVGVRQRRRIEVDTAPDPALDAVRIEPGRKVPTHLPQGPTS